MDAGWAALGGAFLGASAAIGGGLALELYRRHCDRRGVASALAGEVAAILHIATVRDYGPLFEGYLKRLETGIDVRVPPLLAKPLDLDPIWERHIAQVGLLGGMLPAEVVRFYTCLQGIRLDLARLAAGEFDGDPPRKAALIREDLALWTQIPALAEPLIARLTAIANEPLACVRWLRGGRALLATAWTRIAAAIQARRAKR